MKAENTRILTLKFEGDDIEVLDHMMYVVQTSHEENTQDVSADAYEMAENIRAEINDPFR